MDAFDPFLASFVEDLFFSGGGTLAWTCLLYKYL